MQRPDDLPMIAKRYDIYLPLNYNNGIAIEDEKYEQVENNLLFQFNGVTSVSQNNPLRGLWRSEDRVYIDKIIIFTVIDLAVDRSSEGDKFFKSYKEILKEQFQQEIILITAQTLEIV